MPDSPHCSNPGSFRDRSLTGDDRSHGDHVIGIRGMAHPEEKAGNER